MPSLSCNAAQTTLSSLAQMLPGQSQLNAHLDLLLDVLDGVRALNIESNGLRLHATSHPSQHSSNQVSSSHRQSLDEDLHARATAQAQHQVQGRLLLDVVIRQSAAILQLLAGEDQALLIRGNALLVLQCSTNHAQLTCSNAARPKSAECSPGSSA